MISELYKLFSLPVVWCLLLAYAVLPPGLLSAYALVAVAVVAAGANAWRRACARYRRGIGSWLPRC